MQHQQQQQQQPQQTLAGSPSSFERRPQQSMSTFHSELEKCLNDLRERREEVNRLLIAEEDEKASIQKKISMLSDSLAKLHESISRKQRALVEYDRTIEESSNALSKIMDSSQTLLHVLKKESTTLSNLKVNRRG